MKQGDCTTSKGMPLIGISVDVIDRGGRDTAMVACAYADAIAASCGVPILMPPLEAMVGEFLDRLDAIVLTGGDDPRMEAFGVPTHPKANMLHPRRQAFESALIVELDRRGWGTPVLGICLGMQMLALHAGGALDQHMPDSHPNSNSHWDGEHSILPAGIESLPPELRVPAGVVRSRHKQAVSDPGSMLTVATSDDGVIEAIAAPNRPFVLGVQWHPERTHDEALGIGLFQRLVRAATRDAQSR